jgi:L-seryl-tRNA(Ser) seleniumtransferase
MTTSPVQELLRKLPAVEHMLQQTSIQEALRLQPRKLVIESIRQVLTAKRNLLLAAPETAEQVNVAVDHLVEEILQRLEALSEYTLRKVINATGIVIHTNLGRSLLPQEAVDRLQMISQTYNNLEYDLDRGQRGSRYVHAEAILREITGAEAALVVNNNAGAVFLALNTLAKDREVIVSRGQLVEIGGSFRIPDVMRSSGAILREVGCTNRTHLRDYESAICEHTALLLKVHCSNYRIIGFTAEVSLSDLTSLGRKHGLPVMEDLGSGCFVELSPFGLEGEPTVQETVQAGIDVVTFSGDKLLGGPQAGIILGREEFIERCKKNPLTRALRVDKMTLAALEATLRLYRDERRALKDIPTLRMISIPLQNLQEQAHHLAAMLKEMDSAGRFRIEVRQSISQVGGGSLPGQYLPTFVVAVSSSAKSTQAIETALRNGNPPVIGRIESDQYLLDVRTIQRDELETIKQAFEPFLNG